MKASEEWKRYWTVVLAASIGFSFVSFLTPAIGVFMAPLEKAFGWTRTQLSTGLAIAAAISFFASPLLGILLDRIGTRRVALPGIVLTAICTAAFGLSTGSIALWICAWIMWGLTALLIQSIVWSTAIASLFNANRGLALGLTLSGTALAQVVAPPLANWLIASQGWRAAFFILAGGWGGLAFALCIAFFFDTHDLARKRTSLTPAALPETRLYGLSINQAWRSSDLWRIAVSTFLILSITIAVSVHQFPILVGTGESETRAAWLVSLAGFAGISGKLLTGWLVDRMHARWVGGVTLASTAVAYPLMLHNIGSTSLIIVAIIISGYAAGTKIQLCSYLTAKYAGIRSYGAIIGFMTSAIAMASAVGPLGAGAIYDHYGSYDPLLIIGTVASLISGLLVLSLGAYPKWEPAA